MTCNVFDGTLNLTQSNLIYSVCSSVSCAGCFLPLQSVQFTTCSSVVNGLGDSADIAGASTS